MVFHTNTNTHTHIHIWLEKFSANSHPYPYILNAQGLHSFGVVLTTHRAKEEDEKKNSKFIFVHRNGSVAWTWTDRSGSLDLMFFWEFGQFFAPAIFVLFSTWWIQFRFLPFSIFMGIKLNRWMCSRWMMALARSHDDRYTPSLVYHIAHEDCRRWVVIVVKTGAIADIYDESQKLQHNAKKWQLTSN